VTGAALKQGRIGQHGIRIKDQYRAVLCGTKATRTRSRSSTINKHANQGRTAMPKRKKLPPVHPGEVLREDYLIPAGVTVNALALALRVPVSRMYEIVNCARAIT
jgi:hypothetical protein